MSSSTSTATVEQTTPVVTGTNGVHTKTTTLEALASQVQENARIVSDFLRSCGHAGPSFERDSPTTSLPSSAPPDISAARQAIMGAALQMFHLAAGPSEYLPNLAVGYQQIACLRWLTHFKIFHLVPLDSPIAYPSLAAAAGVSVKQLKTVTRMAMTNYLFCEPEPNTVAHTATSTLIASDASFHDWASFMCEASVPMASKLVEATEKWTDSEEKNQTAYNVAFDTDLPFFDHLKTQPDKTRQFANYMKNVQKSGGTGMHYLIEGFDWASLGKGTVVDVGGSSGAASISLATRFPDLNFVVQDLPENAADGQEFLASPEQQEKLGRSVTSRIFFNGHDFFQPQPFQGADAYLLRMILHDWPKKEAVKILQNILPALKDTSRIIIMDTVLPQPGSIPTAQERLLRARDMTMLEAFNSLERDLEDWKELLTSVDERLTLKSVVQPVGSVLSVLEVTFARH
ncbi:putative 6-hydroxytryprostatin B O-methyltransferase [Microsporum ferrugineum]